MTRRLALLAVLLPASAAFGQPAPKPAAKRTDPSMEQIISDARLDLRHPDPQALSRAASLLTAARKMGIWLAAPSPLGIDSDTGVTLSGFDVYSTRERGDQYFRKSAVLVATRVESRETFAALLFEPKEKGVPSSPSAEPSEPEPDMTLASPFTVSLRSRLPRLPWRSGSYIVDILFQNHESNRAAFSLTPGRAADKDPAVAQFIVAQQSAPDGKPFQPFPSGGNYQRTEKSLEIPAEPGISLSVPRVAVYDDGKQNFLTGSFRLPAPAASFQGPSPVVPITLVITGNLSPSPAVVPLFIPAAGELPPNAAEAIVTGQFEIDLFALDSVPKSPQTYTIRAYSGALRSAPALAAFITPEMLK